jgi:predicted nucleic acid-binding protein
VAASLLDTTVLIDALRGRPAGQRIKGLRAAGEDVPYVCAINVEELARGLRAGEERALDRLLDGLRFAAITRADAERSGRWRREFSQRSVTLNQADCLIAAAAVGVGARLITGNPKDFPMHELVVEHWPVGV